ncbi:MAG: M48 family metalloprotease [Candidatus Omnitrophica bacterium]|nr:M48 family metalloprotease [Candidatus Omnitrophota bacterium]
MPYSFTQIEKEKSAIIVYVAGFLVLLYLVISGLIAILLNIFFRRSLFLSPEEWLLIATISIALAIAHYYFSTGDLTGKILRALRARPVNISNEREMLFRNIVDEVSVATGGVFMDTCILPVPSMNAFSIDDTDSTPVIGITEGALLKLSRAQLEAVVAHEAAHIVSGDCWQTTLISSIFEVYKTFFAAIKNAIFDRDQHEKDYNLLGRASGNVVNLIMRMAFNTPVLIVYAVLIILIVIVIFILALLANLLKMFISREREYRADAIATRLTRDPSSLAEALGIISRYWRGQGFSWDGMEGIFIINPRFTGLDESEGFFADLFSTHPPVQRRIDVLLNIAHASPEDFEQKITESLNKIKQEDQKEDAYAKVPTLSSLKKEPSHSCPTCQGPLKEILYENIKLLKCEICSGHFVGEDQISVIFNRRIEQFSEHVKLRAKLIQFPGENFIVENQIAIGPLECPCCWPPKKMVRRLFNRYYPVEVDKCPSCRGIWFEREELELIQYLFESKNPVLS